MLLRSLFKIATLVVLAHALAACHLARNQSSITVAPDSIVLVGVAQNSQGNGLDGVEISPAFPGSQPLTVSDVDGRFSATIGSNVLSQLQAQPSALIKFETPIGQNPHLLADIVVDSAQRGNVDLGSVILRKPGTLKGTVSQFLATQGPNSTKGLAGATVSFAHLQVPTDANGKFNLTNAPVGKFTLEVTYSGLSTFKSEVTVEEGLDTDMQNSIVLFPAGVVDGAVSLQGSYQQKGKFVEGHPYRRSFTIACSSDAEFVRFDADPAALIADPATGSARAPWLKAQGSFDFDFLSNGDKTLYFQFSNHDHSIVSPMHSLVVPLDMFSSSTGFIINDGSGRVYSRRVTLSIDVPPVARLMRIALSEEKLKLALWMPVQSLFDFEIFPKDEENISISPLFSPTIAGSREVFLQFSDGLSGSTSVPSGAPTSSGSESSVFRANALVDLFPPMGQSAFSINYGAMDTTDRFVRVDINLPPNAYQMRLYDETIERSSGQTDWVDAQPVFYYFFQSDGFKTLKLQFRDQGGANSAIYQRSIRVAPFFGILDPFVINNGAGYSLYRDVVLTLNPPPNAVAFRVSENESAFGSGNSNGGGNSGSSPAAVFRELVPQFPILTGGLGLRTFYLQYRDIDGNLSNVFSQSIYVTPFPPGSGDFHINGGASFTMDNILVLDIVPPIAAREMAISDTPFSATTSSIFGGTTSGTTWRPVSTSAIFDVKNRGFKSIYLKFRNDPQGENNSGDESSVLVRNILFDPLPPASVDFVINSGATFTRLPRISIVNSAPSTAYQMRLGNYRPTINGDFDISSLSLIRFENSPTMDLPYADGSYSVCLQVVTFYGDSSSTVCHPIELRLFESQYLGLSLNGEALTAAAPDTSSSSITIVLTPSPAASWVRLAQQTNLTELPHSLSSTPWLALPLSVNADTLTLSSGDGSKRICAQYGAGMLIGGEPEATSGIFCKDINKIP